MNKPRSKEIKRYDSSRQPANRDLPNPGIFSGGVEDEKILLALGQLVATWSQLEERMVYIFAVLTKTEKGPSREIFRSIIAQEAKSQDSLITARR